MPRATSAPGTLPPSSPLLPLTRPVVAGGLALVASVLALAYLLPFRAYGVQVEDEGLLLYQIIRVVEGEIPYIDFMTGYTPGYFYVGAALRSLAGDIPTFRMMLALCQVVIVAGLVVLIAKVARPLFALVLPFLYLVFIPVYPGAFCAFNIPYPAWFATAGWIATAVAMVEFVTGRRRAWLAIAGLASAFAFAVKPNAGVFAIAAASAIVLMVEDAGPERRALAALLWWVLWGGILAGVVFTFGRPTAVDALVYFVPVAAVMLAMVTRRRAGRPTLPADLLVLLGSFAGVTLPWLAFFAVRLGPERFLREMFYIGSNAARVFYVPYPFIELWAWVATAVVLGLALTGAVARRQPRAAITALLLAAVATAAVAVAVLRIGVMPERFTWSVIWQLEHVGFTLTLGAQVAGLIWLVRERRRSRAPARRDRPAAAAVLVPAALLVCGIFMHLQLYPRADFAHLVTSAPLAGVFAAFLLERVCRWWEAGLEASPARGFRPAVAPLAAAVLIVAIALRVAPAVAALRSESRYVLPFPEAPLWIEAEHAADLRALGEAATVLRELVPPGGPSLGFPALDVMLVLSGARNPGRYTYFFAGRPTHLEEASILDLFAERLPAGLASQNRDFTFFDAAPTYYFPLRHFVRARYALAARFGRYDVLAPPHRPRLASVPAGADVETDPRLRAIAALADQPPGQSAPALLDAATSDDAQIRQAALSAFLTALSRVPEPGLEAYVDSVSLDRRRQVLLLRTIRDTRDVRAASYALAMARSPDDRIRREALIALFLSRATMIAREHLWAGPEVPGVWPGRAALLESVRRTLADATATSEAVAFAAEVARHLGETDLVPVLRARLAGERAVAASAASALAKLAPVGLACDLTALLARAEPEIDEVVPTRLIELALGDEPVRAEARRCIAAAIASPGPAQDHAVWVASVVGDPSFVPPLVALLTNPSLDLRRAAMWVLGEIGDPASAAALVAVAATGSDAATRDLARAAAAKIAGERPRVFAPAG